MAAQRSEVVKSLEEEVKCPLCIDIFIGPKKLPCDHVICCHCLGDLITRSHNGLLTCPVCRATTALRGPDASQFPTAHQTNRLIDIYQKTLQEQLEASPAPKTASAEQAEVPMCPVHTSEALALYCETCEKSVCRDCALTSCAVKKHNYGFFKDMARKYEDMLKREIQPVKQLQQDIAAALVDITDKEEELHKLKEEEEQKLDAAFDRLVSSVMKEKLRIKQDIEERFNQQALNNSSKTEELTNTLGKIESSVELVETMFTERDSVSKFSKVATTKKKIGDLHHRMKTLALEPKPFEGLDVKLELIPGSFNAKQFVYQTRNEFRYLLTEYNMLKSLKINQPFKMDVYSTSNFYKADDIKSSFVSLFDNSSTPVSITKVLPNMVRLEFTPRYRGRHELHIHLHDNTAICGSPISSFVFVDPQQVSLLGKPKQTSVANVAPIKCSNNEIYATSVEKEIVILEHRKRSVLGYSSLSVTGKIPLPGVGEILVWGEYIYYSNIQRHRLVKIHKDTHVVLGAVGGWGTKPEFFMFPNGIRISKKNEIYVCDSDNHRIQVFDTDLNLLRIIGSQGIHSGEFLTPYDLVFDEMENIYVVENGNERVQVLTPDGNFVRSIGTSGSNFLIKPGSSAIHNGHIYVTNQGRKCIFVYTLDGEFIASFGEKDNLKPECIDIDQDGYIYVSSSRKAIFVY